ncbi:hypothetical protein HPB48_002028 [Haemaphysalis longicornis]|uniref:C2 domain-containing protein n=1 Tax=Haemaphysalis longicornis TaxID=44386 RepID=A0A9J6FKV9_HAELO|nr:hypothetical protein HPB48_002028 [Haemaphysalis longicornis]
MAKAALPFAPAVACAPVTKVEISVSCRQLKDMDFFSKSDPMCVLFMRESDSDRWREVGRTETIDNCLNPDFVTKFIVDYYFEERQQLMFKVYDIDSPSVDLQNHDFLGQASCTLGELVAYQGTQMKFQLSGLPGNCGTILLTVEEVLDCKRVIDMQWYGQKLDKKDWFGKSDPFLEFYRVSEDNSYTAVFRTEVVKKSLNPTWRPFAIQMRQLSGGDEDRTIASSATTGTLTAGDLPPPRCVAYHSVSRSHDHIGEFYTNVRTLAQGPGPANEYERNGKMEVMLTSVRLSAPTSWVASLQMHFTVAVDFTASNGDPRDPGSLHFLDASQPNAYMMAIRAVGEVIQDYDYDKMFPALGFGARLPPDGVVSHEFFLNGHPTDPYCAGIDGVLEAYRRTLRSVQLYGPTNFAPVINHVAKFARTYRDGTSYFVLLIITDGVISDMPQTQEAVVQASTLPMSIIIVGVGNADFSGECWLRLLGRLRQASRRLSH